MNNILKFTIYTIIFFGCIFSPFATKAQSASWWSFELAGSGGLGSFNYEKTFADKPNFDFNWRVGFSVAPIDKNNGAALVFPVMVHTVAGNGNFKPDLGIGQTLSVTTKGHLFFMLPASAGCRFQPENKNYYLRLSYTPIISYLIDFQIQHWGGFTYAYTFNK
ncbi:MAG: hypothetical protein IPL12_19115 [Bacteroidetes bacterium]|nr:hypothetical protein [Bacteroidota bacterium]MBK8345201.1 hypothetical protein [Bacteroidota bacterium]